MHKCNKKMPSAFCAIFFGLIVISTTARATLELELTQGISSAIPIAFMPFAASGDAMNKADALLSVLKNDLQNSGRFRLSAINLPRLDYDLLRQQKIDNAVNGSIEPIGQDKYKITLQLHDVFTSSILLDDRYFVTAIELRRLAHHIGDRIYEKLTGIRGIFSTHIAYISVQRPPGKPAKYSLEIADADGYNPRSIMVSNEPIMSPTWSPDGKRIAYVSFENKRAAIFAQDIATGARQIISKFPGINGAPAWSPDGSKMALVLTQTGDPKIYLLDLASKRLRQLTFGRSLDTEPNFSPDGRTLIFTSNRGGSPQIYKLDLSNGNSERLTYQGNYNAHASFTPDGKNIVMLHQEGDMFNIAIQNLSSGRLNVLTQTGFDESPSIAPNGSMIAYATTYKGKGMLAEVSSDGRVKLLLPAHEGEVQEPAWK